MATLLLVDEPAPHVRRLTLNRPEQLNAMTSELCEELHGALRAIAAVNGPAAGLGFALTLGCDIRYSSPRPSSAPRSSTSACRTATWARAGCCRA